MNKQRLIILIASALGMLATFLPWMRVPLLGSMTGTSLPPRWEYNGWISLVLFGVPLAFSLSGDQKTKLTKNLLIAVSIFSILAFLNILAVYFDFKNETDGIRASIESGIYLTIIAALILIIFALKDLKLKFRIDISEKTIGIKFLFLFLTFIGMFSTFLPWAIMKLDGKDVKDYYTDLWYLSLLFVIPFFLFLSSGLTKKLSNRFFYSIIITLFCIVIYAIIIVFQNERYLRLYRDGLYNVIHRIELADCYLAISVGIISLVSAFYLKEKNNIS